MKCSRSYAGNSPDQILSGSSGIVYLLWSLSFLASPQRYRLEVQIGFILKRNQLEGERLKYFCGDVLHIFIGMIGEEAPGFMRVIGPGAFSLYATIDAQIKEAARF